MIKISRLADYGLIILNGMAAEPAHYYSAAVLAERTGIALPTVSKVLKLLNEAHVISSTRGANGGYRLLKQPEQLSVAEVIAAVDGTPALTECCQRDNGCVLDSRCTLRSNWQLINQVIIRVLSQFTLADLNRPLALNNALVQRVSMGGDCHAK